MKPDRPGDESNPNWLWLMALPFVFMCAGPVSAFLVSPGRLTTMRREAARRDALDWMSATYTLVMEAASKKGGKYPDFATPNALLSAAVAKKANPNTIGFVAGCDFNRDLSQKPVSQLSNPKDVWLAKRAIDGSRGEWVLCFANGSKRLVTIAEAESAARVKPIMIVK